MCFLKTQVLRNFILWPPNILEAFFFYRFTQQSLISWNRLLPVRIVADASSNLS